VSSARGTATGKRKGSCERERAGPGKGFNGRQAAHVVGHVHRRAERVDGVIDLVLDRTAQARV